MFFHFYLANNVLYDLIRFRVIDGYQPIVGSSVLNAFGYMDGMENVTLIKAQPDPPQTISFTLNVAGPNSAVPAPDAAPVKVPAVALRVRAELYFVAPADLPTAPGANGIFPRPKRFPIYPDLGLLLFLTIDDKSQPVLNTQIYDNPFASLGISNPSLGNSSIPLPIGAGLPYVAAPGARVLNAGIAPTSDEAGYVIRVEVSEPQMPSSAERMAAWQSFFAGHQPSRLGIRGWAAEVPTTYLLQVAQAQFDQQMTSFSVEKIFTNYDPSWASWTWDAPQMVLKKHGFFDHACAGLDLQATVIITLTLSVPAANTVRLSTHLDIDMDDWDLFKCDLALILNPLGAVITAFDNTHLPWFGVLGVSAIVNAVAPVLLIALAVAKPFLLSLALQQIQDTLQKKGVNVVRTSDDDAYVDFVIPLDGLASAAWMSLQEVAAVGDHLIMRGDSHPPRFDVPLHLTGVLLDGFDGWSKPKCSAPSLSDFKTSATLELQLLDPAGNNVLVPVIGLKCGLDITTGSAACMGVVDDPQNMYDLRRENTLYHWTGVPGTLEIDVKGPTESFAQNPYGLHLRMFTNFGTREFDFPAPRPTPKLPSTPSEVIMEAAERISQCYAISSLLARIKALQVFWAPYPQPEYKTHQHWQIRVENLSATDRIRAWDPEHGTVLAEVGTWGDKVADLSMVMEEPMQTLQLTLNDQQMLSMNDYVQRSHELVAQEASAREHTVLNAVTIQQTPLLPLAEIPLPLRADAISLRLTSSELALRVWNQEEAWNVQMQPRYVQNWAVSRIADATGLRQYLPTAGISVRSERREGRAVTRIISPMGREIARYIVRPWFDRGGVAGQFFARLNATGDRVMLYSRRATRIAYPQLGNQKI